MIRRCMILIRSLTFLEYLDSLRGTNVLARHAEYAVLFADHERLLVRSGVTRSLQPFIDVDRTGLDARSVGDADIEINTDIITPYS